MRDTKQYNRWNNMKQRCYNSNHPAFHNYGARGIAVCAQWLKDFKQFDADVLAEIGPCPGGYSFDRKDNDGDYQPGNIRWATPSEQRLNCRRKPKKPPRLRSRVRRLQYAALPELRLDELVAAIKG